MKPHQFWCIGRNFREHAAELGNPIPERPLIFLKSGRCLQSGPEIRFPSFCEDVHHELEIVLLLGENLEVSNWTLGLDLTERKIQNELKQLGQPWELAKSFKGAAVLGPWQAISSLTELEEAEFSLKVNDFQRQQGSVRNMIFGFQPLIKYLRDRFPIGPGDAIMTGTPAGVGPLRSGDRLEAQCGSLIVHWKVSSVAS